MNPVARINPADRPEPFEHGVPSWRPAGEPRIAPEFPLRQLLMLVRRRIGLILTITLFGTILTSIVALLIPPKYTARAQIVVESPQAAIAGDHGAPPSAELMASQIDTQVTMLTSRNHLRHVLDSLSSDPEFGPAVSQGAVEPDAPPEKVTPGAKDSATKTGVPSLDELKRRLNYWTGSLIRIGHAAGLDLDALERYLEIYQERNSRVITVSFTSTSPVVAAAVANRIVQSYIYYQEEQKRASMAQKFVRLRERISDSKNEMERVNAAVQSLIQQRLAAVQGGNAEGREIEARLRELQSGATVNGQLHDSLLRRQRELREQQESISSDVRILSLAWPPNRPSSPNPILFLLPALVFFVICGCFLAVIVERFDRSLRSERDINNALGIHCVGLVPKLSWTRRTRPHQVLLSKKSVAYTEAIQAVVAALKLTTSDSVPVVVQVSSSLPGEGKTTLAVSLAAYAAFLGRRTLLVDLDFRRPATMREFNRKPQSGILDLLLHGRPLAEVIQRIPELKLDYLPMLGGPVDPLALFANEQISRLLRQLRESYDCVVIDSSPILGVTEARLLAPMVDKVLFVVKWGKTKQEVAQGALRQLRDPANRECVAQPIAVVTNVDLKKHARYQYGDATQSFMRHKRYFSRSGNQTAGMESMRGSATGLGDKDLFREKMAADDRADTPVMGTIAGLDA